MKNTDKQSELFRLATVLYADNNYEVSLKTIHRKIIESALLELSKESSTHEIVDFIEKQYNIIISEDNLSEVTNKDSDKFHSIIKNNEKYISLTEKRKIQLQDKIKDKTLDYFIDIFEKEYPAFSGSKDLINKFIYDIFITNTESFQKLLDNKKEVTDLLNINSVNYSEKEKEIINNFLFWDNVEKNRTIFNISSYALEYCMLTNKNGNKTIELKELRNKSFYLDTNIIYRGLGINGDNRKNRTRTFLRKFLDADEKLIISRSTDREFKDSIKSHIKKLNAYNSPRVRSKLFQLAQVQKDIYNFYHLWRSNKVNNSTDMFQAEILRLYSEFKKEFQVEYDANEPYDKKNTKIVEELKSYTSEISQLKTDSIDKAEFDAENILWVETKRNGNAENIFDTKFFFISTDQGLRRWDYQRKNLTPIVLLPSQWMTIILRYFQCTDDDFKSFISFLNLKNNEKLIDGDKLHIVLAGISEMTENFEHQNIILNSLIVTKFEGIIKKDSTSEQIFENSKKFAKTELETLLETQQANIKSLKENNKIIEDKAKSLDNKHNEVNRKLDDLTEKFTHDIETTQEKLQNAIDSANAIKEHANEMEEINESLKGQLRQNYIDSEIINWRRPVKWYVTLIIFILIFFFFQFFFREFEYNIITPLIDWIDQHPSESARNLFNVINGAIFTGLLTLIILTYRRRFCPNTKEKQIVKIKQQMPKEYQ